MNYLCFDTNIYIDYILTDKEIVSRYLDGDFEELHTVELFIKEMESLTKFKKYKILLPEIIELEFDKKTEKLENK